MGESGARQVGDRPKTSELSCKRTILTVKVRDLSMEDGSVTNFAVGSHLLLEHRGKSYPVEFVSFAGVLLKF